MAIFYFGSFQIGQVTSTENALEEIWSYVARLGTAEFLETLANGGSDWESRKSYATIRIRQAVELRLAAQEASLLTRPLPLYYSALNLLRAAIALVTERKPTPAHGLRHKAAFLPLDNAAIIVSGTYTDYLRHAGAAPTPKDILTLRECLAMIPEVADDFTFPTRGRSNVLPVRVEYDSHRGLLLTFPRAFVDPAKFRDNWQVYFPGLKEICTFEEEFTLLVARGEHLSSYEEIGRFCRAHLENRLTFNDQATWYAIRRDTVGTILPRLAYYMAALFILSSLVRYEPELLFATATPPSELGWFLERFLGAAERFVPQLICSWVTGTDLYFSEVT